MCRTITLSVAILFVFVAAESAADARPRPTSRSFSANKTFGLGLMLGAPAGLSGKYYLGADTALDFGVGVYHGFRYEDAVHIHADFLWHPASLASTGAFELPIYVGVGGRLLNHERYRDEYYDDTHVGVRGPVGIMFDFNRVPLDIFLELALVIDVIVDRDHHGYADLNGAFGLRYYF